MCNSIDYRMSLCGNHVMATPPTHPLQTSWPTPLYKYITTEVYTHFLHFLELFLSVYAVTFITCTKHLWNFTTNTLQNFPGQTGQTGQSSLMEIDASLLKYCIDTVQSTRYMHHIMCFCGTTSEVSRQLKVCIPNTPLQV